MKITLISYKLSKLELELKVKWGLIKKTKVVPLDLIDTNHPLVEVLHSQLKEKRDPICIPITEGAIKYEVLCSFKLATKLQNELKEHDIQIEWEENPKHFCLGFFIKYITYFLQPSE